MQRNNLMRMRDANQAMRGIQQNQLLSSAGRQTRPANKITDPTRIREAILDQRKVDTKIEMGKFNMLADKMKRVQPTEREKLWGARTNQPYKNILPVTEFKKEYKTQSELVIYKVKKEDKDERVFEKNASSMKQAIAQHNKELTDTYSTVKKDEHEKQFQYNHVTKYNVKYDPTNFAEMKDNIVDYYKKEQQEQEKDKQCVDEIIEQMVDGELTHQPTPPITTSPTPTSSTTPPPQQAQNPNKGDGDDSDEEVIPDDKYIQRQKK